MCDDEIYYGKEALKMALDGHKMIVAVGDDLWREEETLEWVDDSYVFFSDNTELGVFPPQCVGFKVHKEPKFKKGDPVRVDCYGGSYRIGFITGGKRNGVWQISNNSEANPNTYNNYGVKEKYLTLIEIKEVD